MPATILQVLCAGYRSLVLFLEQRSQVSFCTIDLLVDLDHNCTLESNFVSFVKSSLVFPMHVSDEVARHIVEHDAFVESVVFEEAILPSLGFSADVVGVETSELDNRCSVLSEGNIDCC